MLWKKEQVETAMKILGKYSRVCDALPEIEKTVNRKVTASSLKHAMKQRGADAPSYYLQRDLVSAKTDDVLIGGHVYAERQARLLDEAARKADNAWIRNMDIDLSDAIRPVDGLADTKFVHKTFPYTIKDMGYAETVPGFTKEIVYGERKDKIRRILVCPDAHIPNHDKTAWKVFLKALRVVKPDVLVLIGDYCDMESTSAHPKKPTDERSLKHEVELVNASLDEIRAAYAGRIVYCFGNHEHRTERFLNKNAPELDGLVHLKDLLKLEERNIEYHAYGEFVRIGEMIFVHDVGRCGINTARQTLIDVGDNVCVGHSHRAAVVYGGTVDGKTHVCINTGWIGSYDAISYRNVNTAKREWQHAFSMIYQDEDGVSYCNLVPIIKGKCIVDGNLIDVN